MIPKTLLELHKIEPLDGTNYKHWSQKLLLCFEQLQIDYVLTSDLLDDSKITTDVDFTEPSTLAVPKHLPSHLMMPPRKNLKRTTNWLGVIY